MVIYSNEIKDFLDKLYFYELTHRNDLEFPLYNYYEEKLYNIDKLSRHIPSTTFPMSRDGLFGLIVGRLEFGYSFDGVNACVEYYINREPQNDWFDWLIKESKGKSFINLHHLNESDISNMQFVHFNETLYWTSDCIRNKMYAFINPNKNPFVTKFPFVNFDLRDRKKCNLKLFKKVY